MTTALWCLLCFVLGVAAIPTARTLRELGASLREHWAHLDYYDTDSRRRHTPVIGRAIHRVMRALKGGRS
jgi:hypothetical protein